MEWYYKYYDKDYGVRGRMSTNNTSTHMEKQHKNGQKYNLTPAELKKTALK